VPGTNGYGKIRRGRFPIVIAHFCLELNSDRTGESLGDGQSSQGPSDANGRFEGCDGDLIAGKIEYRGGVYVPR